MSGQTGKEVLLSPSVASLGQAASAVNYFGIHLLMTTRKSCLIIPGINIKILKQLATYGLPIGICMGYTALLLVWRSQITLAMQPILTDAKAIQGLESQKLTASRLANNQWTRWLLAFNAIAETISLSAKDLISEDGKPKPPEEISDTLIGLASGLATAPQQEANKPGKVLPDSAITEETANIHRRGLMGRLRVANQSYLQPWRNLTRCQCRVSKRS